MLALKDGNLFRQQCYLNGHWVNGEKKIPVVNPANGEVIATVPSLGCEEVRQAIHFANDAWPAWRKKTAKQRASILKRWFDLIVEHTNDLALILTTEQGKPLSEAKAEIANAASYVEWFAEEGKRIYGENIPSHLSDRRLMVTKEPIGICVAITPWNFPSAMITRKVAPALAAGCPIILKPAELTPLSAFALAELADRAGVPPGIFQVVTGSSSEIGEEFTLNPLVRKLSFTGSTRVGRLLMTQCASTIKKVSMELGGNAPFIVFDDADIDAAVEGAVASKFRNSGQTCVSANRIYVQEGVYEEFSKKLAIAVSQIKVGDGLKAGVLQGPMINEKAVEKVEDHIGDAVHKGAKILVGGRRHDLGGSYFEPTVLVDVTQQMSVAHEETFGPLAPLFKFKTESEVISYANDTEFGLAAYFYSRDLKRVFRVSEALETGMVAVNSGLIATECAPFGGVKQSGLGREGSKYGIEDYVVIKYTCIAGLGD